MCTHTRTELNPSLFLFHSHYVHDIHFHPASASLHPPAVPAGKDETTNKLFEAQVAVMGFKCRVMQLKGELDDLRKEGGIDASTKEEMERLRTENATLHDDIMRYKKDRDAAAKRLPSPQQVSSGTSQHDQVQFYD